MWWWMAVALAGEIHVSTPVPMVVTVDGQEVPYGRGGLFAVASDLSPGPHVVAVRDPHQGRSASLEVDVPADRLLQVRYARNRLVVVGTATIAPPEAPEPRADAGGSLLVAGIGNLSGRVWIDGRPVAYAPEHEGFPGVALSAGAHELRIEDHGRVRYSGPVEVRADQTHRCVPQLRQGGWELDCHWLVGTIAADGEVAPPPPDRPVAIEEPALAELRERIEAVGFSSDRIALLKTAAVYHWFTIAQVGTLVDLLSFASDKVEAVAILRPRVLDPENAHELDAHFAFSSDREAVQELFREPPP